MIGTTELILIAGIALLLFGGKKLPELMRGMGRGVKNFREGLNEPSEPDKATPDEQPEAHQGQQAATGTPTDGPTAQKPADKRSDTDATRNDQHHE